MTALTTTLCLTIDIDWALDEVIRDTLGLISEFGCPATWFFTHDTPTLAEVASSGAHEIGLHPNFNPLLDGSTGAARETLTALRLLAPEARSIRSHSLTRSSRLASLFVECSFTHESNIFIPPGVGADLWCWRDFGGLVQVPIRWEDDLRLVDASLGEPVDYVNRLRLFTVNVHPIHVYLNTTTIEDYEAARPYFRTLPALNRCRRPPGSGGTRDRLIAVLECVRTAGAPTLRMSDLVTEPSQARKS
jgi:hypothetical protein